MSRIGRRFELPFLLAAQPQLSANPFDAIQAGCDAMIGWIGLETLGAVGCPRQLMRGPDLGFQPDGLLLARRRWAFTPGVIAAFGYSQ